MLLNKNDIIEIEITDLGAEGGGVGHYASEGENMAVFVAGGVPGDVMKVRIVKTKKSYCYGIPEKIIKYSDWRSEPVCPIYKRCGGCQLQHIKYEKQLEYKQNKVYNCIARIGGINNIPMEPIIGMQADTCGIPCNYRNKAQFPVGRDIKGNVAIGFYAERSHDIIDSSECLIQAKVNKGIISAVRSFMRENRIEPYNEMTKRGLIRHIFTRVGFTTGELMVCLVINGQKLPNADNLLQMLKKSAAEYNLGLASFCVNINCEDTNCILGNQVKLIYGSEYITDFIGDVKFNISPLSFYQVNPVQTKELYDIVLEYADLSGDETIWDLYCGIGTISLYMARKAKKVYGIEIVPEAVEDAKRNAALNNMTNAEFFTGAAEDVLPLCRKHVLEHAEVVVVDPPRKGCDEQLLATIIEMSPEKLIYVSCDPATLARDLKYLCNNGYELKRVRAVDQFCNTVHVETCVLLSHKNS